MNKIDFPIPGIRSMAEGTSLDRAVWPSKACCLLMHMDDCYIWSSYLIPAACERQSRQDSGSCQPAQSAAVHKQEALAEAEGCEGDKAV